MFKYMDEFTQSLVRSAQAVYEFSTSNQPEAYHLLTKYLNDDRFWSDVCQFHFKLNPLPGQNARAMFQQCFEDRKEFKTLSVQVNQFIATGDYQKALNVAEQAAKKFGLVGHILELNVCQHATNKGETCFSQVALESLDHIEAKQLEARSIHYQKIFGWDVIIANQYRGISNILISGRTFFGATEQVTSASP